MPPHPAAHRGPLVYVDDLAAPILDDGALHHLQRVLRLRAGAPLVLGDGRGSWCPARFSERPEITGAVECAEAPQPALSVGFALVKGDKPELVVQKLTELGVDRILPFRAARSVVRWDGERARKATGRLRQVARSAAAQCHRPWLPEVAEVTDLAHLLSGADGGLAVGERGGQAVRPRVTTILVGPEGGWAEAEVPPGVPRVSLGPHVLRAETAAIVAGALLADRRADLAG